MASMIPVKIERISRASSGGGGGKEVMGASRNGGGFRREQASCRIAAMPLFKAASVRGKSGRPCEAPLRARARCASARFAEALLDRLEDQPRDLRLAALGTPRPGRW